MLPDCFSDPEFHSFFSELLDMDCSKEEKYRLLLEFCNQQRERQNAGQNDERKPGAGSMARSAPAEAISPLAQVQPGLMEQTADSLRRALLRMKASCHTDGGWGKEVEQSTFWHTAHAVLFLHAAQDLPGVGWSGELDELLQRGVAWMEQQHENWSVDSLALTAGISTYNVGLMVRCFFRLGRTFFLRRETMQRVYRSLDRLYHTQNADGGWDANIWSYEITTPTRIWSEAGATGAALMALAETNDERFLNVVSRGVRWLAATQNPEGSWNDGSCHPLLPEHQLTGQPSVAKTADAMQGLMASGRLGVSLAAYPGSLDQALGWLHRQGKRILNPDAQGAGWAVGFTKAEYENATLTLETLLQLPDPRRGAAMPALVGVAAWLVGVQRKCDGDLNDGSWVLGDTARTGLALAGFYRQIVGGQPSERMPWVL